MARLVVASLLLAAVAWAGTASASEPFPEGIRTHLGLSVAPGCDLCHSAAAAPVGPADKPFSKSAKARGLVAGDLASLNAALDKMAADGVDSDGDGAEDLDELWWGGDPNLADLPAGGKAIPPTYGCAFGDRPAGRGSLLFGGMVLLLLARRRRARRARGATTG